MKVAKSVALDNRTGEVTIDGERFEFYLAAEPLRVTVGGADAMSVVYLPLLVDADGVITINGERAASGEHAVPPRPSDSGGAL